MSDTSRRREYVLATVAVVVVVFVLSVVTVASIQHTSQSGTRCAPTSTKGTVVDVSLDDHGPMMMAAPMGMRLNASPDQVAAGDVTFVAHNVGSLVHELVVMPESDAGIGGRTVNDEGQVDETTSLGEASQSCGAGAGSGIEPGTTGWVTLHLSAGTYELLCDVPWHYGQGMFESFLVK